MSGPTIFIGAGEARGELQRVRKGCNYKSDCTSMLSSAFLQRKREDERREEKRGKD